MFSKVTLSLLSKQPGVSWKSTSEWR